MTQFDIYKRTYFGDYLMFIFLFKEFQCYWGGLWDVKLTWNSSKATHWICLYGLEYSPGIHNLQAYLTLPNCWDSFNQNKVSLNVWFLYFDQLGLHLWHKKYFLLFLLLYGTIWIWKAEVPKLDYIAHLSVWLSNHTVKQCTTCLHTNYHDTNNHSKYLKNYVICAKQTSSYQNISKLLTHPNI